jgi:hypothetical protein
MVVRNAACAVILIAQLAGLGSFCGESPQSTGRMVTSEQQCFPPVERDWCPTVPRGPLPPLPPGPYNPFPIPSIPQDCGCNLCICRLGCKCGCQKPWKPQPIYGGVGGANE